MKKTNVTRKGNGPFATSGQPFGESGAGANPQTTILVERDNRSANRNNDLTGKPSSSIGSIPMVTQSQRKTGNYELPSLAKEGRFAHEIRRTTSWKEVSTLGLGQQHRTSIKKKGCSRSPSLKKPTSNLARSVTALSRQPLVFGEAGSLFALPLH